MLEKNSKIGINSNSKQILMFVGLITFLLTSVCGVSSAKTVDSIETLFASAKSSKSCQLHLDQVMNVPSKKEIGDAVKSYILSKKDLPGAGVTPVLSGLNTQSFRHSVIASPYDSSTALVYTQLELDGSVPMPKFLVHIVKLNIKDGSVLSIIPAGKYAQDDFVEKSELGARFSSGRVTGIEFLPDNRTVAIKHVSDILSQARDITWRDIIYIIDLQTGVFEDKIAPSTSSLIPTLDGSEEVYDLYDVEGLGRNNQIIVDPENPNIIYYKMLTREVVKHRSMEMCPPLYVAWYLARELVSVQYFRLERGQKRLDNSNSLSGLTHVGSKPMFEGNYSVPPSYPGCQNASAATSDVSKFRRYVGKNRTTSWVME